MDNKPSLLDAVRPHLTGKPNIVTLINGPMTTVDGEVRCGVQHVLISVGFEGHDAEVKAQHDAIRAVLEGLRALTPSSSPAPRN